MKDTDIFTSGGYDMVVAITQKSINDQIAHLAKPEVGVIKTDLIVSIKPTEDGSNQFPIFYTGWEHVEKDEKGLPTIPTIHGQYMPSINITSSGTSVEFSLKFLSGKAYTSNPLNPKKTIEREMKDWVYTIPIELDFARIYREDTSGKLPVPKQVSDELDRFTTDEFSVSSLFVKFDSVDLMNVDVAATKPDDNPDGLQSFFVYFMSRFLHYLHADPKKNPYILGYTISTTNKTKANAKNQLANIPPTLKPVGNTFTVFHDTKNPDLSTVNFILNTQVSGGTHGSGHHPTPGNFDENWITSKDDYEGKMIYSSFCFLESLILIPFYKSYSKSTYDQVKKSLSLSKKSNIYSGAKHGWSFQVHDETNNGDEYSNNFKVTWTTESTEVIIHLNGTIVMKKSAQRNMVFCEANTYKKSTVNWSGSFHVKLSYDKTTDAVNLKCTGPTIKSTSKTEDYENKCARDLDWVTEFFKIWANPFFIFSKAAFLDVMTTDVTGNSPLPSLNLAMTAASVAAKNSFMLPAGDIFFFKSVDILPEGPISLNLKYKTATDGTPQMSNHFATNGSKHGKASHRDSTRQPSKFPMVQTTNSVGGKKLAIGSQMDEFKSTFNQNSEDKAKASHLPHSSMAAQSEERSGTAPADESTDKTIAEFSEPLIDQFSVNPPETSSLKDSIDISVSCELMHNSEAAMPVAPNKDMIVVQDVNSRALIFTIGSDGQFNLLTGSSAETSSGWTSTNLLDSFPDHSSAICFDVVQSIDGRLSLAFALQRQGNALVDIFFALLLSNDLTRTDFGKLAANSSQLQGVDAAFTPESIRIGSSDDGRQPMLTVEGSLHENHLLYQRDGNETKLKQRDDVDEIKVKQLQLPEDVTPGKENMIAHRTGFNYGQRGNYFLYNVEGSRHLLVRTDDLDYDYSPGNSHLPIQFQQLTYNCIQTATSRTDPDDPSSDLYIGSPNGVYRIPNGMASSMEEVTDSVLDVHGIVVTAHKDQISLWITSSPNSLYYVSGQRTSGSPTDIKWNMPILFAQGVLKAATMWNLAKDSHELFVLKQDLAVWHYWQDRESTIWRCSKAIVKKDTYVLEFDSYTTHVHFESKGIQLLEQKVKITSSEWQYCTINGLKYSLDQDAPAEVEVDSQGNITIISAAVDISPPIIHIQSDDFVETVNIYPSGKVIKHLQSIKDGASLRAAKSQDGTPVLRSHIKKDAVDAVAANVATLREASCAKYPPSLHGNNFAVLEKPSADGTKTMKHTLNTALPTDALPPDFAVGMRITKGGWVEHTADTAHAHLASLASLYSLGSALDDIGNKFGDFVHHLEQFGGHILSGLEDAGVFLKDGINFIIHKAGDVLQFVLTIGQKVIRFALKTFVFVFKALSWVLSLVGIDLPAILRWLGHLLGWDQVWDTHKLIADTITNFVDYGEPLVATYVNKAREVAKEFFKTIDKDIKNAILPSSLQKKTPSDAAASDAVKLKMHSPQGNFLAYHLSNAGRSSSTDDATKKNYAMSSSTSSTNRIKHSGPEKNVYSMHVHDRDQTLSGTESGDAFEKFANDIVVPMEEKLREKLGMDLDDFIDLLKHGSMDNVWRLIADAANTVLSLMGEFVERMLDFSQDVLNGIKDILTQPLEIPFFTELYEFVCGLMGYEEKFTLLNGVSFLISIPVTIMTKIGGFGSILDHNIGMDSPEFPKSILTFVQAALNPTTYASRPHEFSTSKVTEWDPPVQMILYSGIAGLIASTAAVVQNGLIVLELNDRDLQWSRGLNIGLAIIRMACSAPLPSKRFRDVAWGLRILAWVGGLWRLAVLFQNPLSTIIKFSKFVNNLIVAVVAVICDSLDQVNDWVISGDVVSNFSGTFASLGSCMEVVPMEQIASAMAIIGNIVTLTNACIVIGEEDHMWKGIL